MSKITVQDYIDGKATGRSVFITTFSGRHEVRYIRNPDTDPWIVTGKGMFTSSWCVHYGTELEVE